ncbi:MAG: sulfurtransferase TusA family protein [Eubacteriales bacterium]|nr:sulfurtransferase TusA family protein [Eubacteriales bacterium]
MFDVDARGRSCPEPVVMTRNAVLAHPEGVSVRVDNPCAAENITRFGKNAGCKVQRRDEGNESVLVLTR